MYTVIVKSPDGDATYKYSDKSFVDRWKISGYLAIAKLSQQYDTQVAFEAIEMRSKIVASACQRVVPYRSLFDSTVELLYDSFDNDFDAISSHVCRYELPMTSKGRVYVPQVMERFIDVYSNDRGNAVGKGEILALLMFGDAIGSPNARYDISIDGKSWHIKDHRNCDSTPLGRPSMSDSDFDWTSSDIMNFMRQLGASSDFGNTFFKGQRHLEQKLVKRYNRSLKESAGMLEQELNEMVRNSHLMGEAQGILFLKHDSDTNQYYFERLDRNDVLFHSVSSGSIKICDISGRYVEMIMHSTNRDEAERAIEEKRRLRLEEKLKRLKRLTEEKESAKLMRLKQIEARRAAKEQAVIQKRLEKIENKKKMYADFVRSWNNAQNLDILSKDLGLSKQYLRTKKTKIESTFPGLFSFKKFNRSPRKPLRAVLGAVDIASRAIACNGSR